MTNMVDRVKYNESYMGGEVDDSHHMLQYGLWSNCNNNCDYCLRMNRIPYSKEEQIRWIHILRDNINSNSALLVDIKPSDYDKGSVLDGLYYHEKYEKMAFEISNDYKAPANLCKEFLNDEVAKELRSVKTSYPHGLKLCDLRLCLPDFVIDNLKFGINEFDKKLHGFKYDDAVIIGIESRSSSPVRILRDENRESNIKGIYPIGEGAGYAGGITSAALDGLKTALRIVGE